MENNFLKHITRDEKTINKRESERQARLTENSCLSAIIEKEGEVERLSTAAVETITASKDGKVDWCKFIEKDNLQEIAKDELDRLIKAYKHWFGKDYLTSVLKESDETEN